MDELATLARDCPAPERDARPRDASEVARRVTAYLTGVQDRLRQAELDRARAEAKAVEERKRRRVQLGLAASVAGFTLLGAVGLAVFASVVQSQKQALAPANSDLAKANSDLTAQRARAETREQQAIDAVKRFRDAVADNPMLKNSPELEDLRKTLLKEPLAFFKSLREQLQADNDTRPEALARLAAAAFDLGYLTDEIGDKPDAIRAYDAAREIFERLARDHPAVTAYAQDLARTHNNLGNLLATTGDPAGARRAYEAAREIFERLARDHPEMPGYASALGATLNNLAMLDLAARRWLPARALLKQAITWQKQALAANLRHPEYRQSLGMHLRNLIQAADALGNDAEIADAWRELAELAASDPARAVLETRLAAVIGGETPRDNAERLALAQRAYDTQRYALAARLWGEALEDDPTLADDRQRQHRYNAACAAALAAALASGGRQPPDASMPGGAGEPSRGGSGGLHPPLAEEGAALRARALGWLRAELEIWARIVDTDEPPGRALVAQTLTHWQGDPDLASVRGEAIDAFPEGEREGWRAMWAEVERLRERAGSDGSSG
jgi:tetratricopeptide (TPR) repeat protein